MERNGTIDEKGLSAKQTRFLAALLAQPTVEKAAGAAKIGTTTGYRYLRQPAFQAAYREARLLLVQQSVALLQQSGAVAVVVLRQVALDQDAPASARVSAARSILELAIDGAQNDLAAEVAEIRAELEAWARGTQEPALLRETTER